MNQTKFKILVKFLNGYFREGPLHPEPVDVFNLPTVDVYYEAGLEFEDNLLKEPDKENILRHYLFELTKFSKIQEGENFLINGSIRHDRSGKIFYRNQHDIEGLIAENHNYWWQSNLAFVSFVKKYLEPGFKKYGLDFIQACHQVNFSISSISQDSLVEYPDFFESDIPKQSEALAKPIIFPRIKDDHKNELLRIFRDYFIDQVEPIENWIIREKQPDSKLVFNGTAVQILSALKLLHAHKIIFGISQKKQLIEWVCNNISYTSNGLPKEIKPRLAEKYISGIEDVAKANRIIKISDKGDLMQVVQKKRGHF